MELREITDSEPKNKSAFLNVQEANSTEVSQVNKALWQTEEHDMGSVRDDQGYKMGADFQ